MFHRMFHKLATVIIAVLVFSLSAYANPPPKIGEVLSGDTFTLSDSHTIYLESIAAPSRETEELAEQSRHTLQQLIGIYEPELENTSMDRYGRISAQAFLTQADGTRLHIQEAMLGKGMAFVYAPKGNEPDLENLLNIENRARETKTGIWADDAYADIPAARAGKVYGRFAFITGKVLKAERIKNKVYLNFGDDWRKDFTITIVAHDLRAFYDADLDPMDYEGMTVRVRGWVKRDFGPMVTVTNPAQIEILANSVK